jgi:ATP diphosphatase
MQRLLQVMRQLRDPEHGCPWDREQTFASIAPFTIEEAYEVADAVAAGDPQQLRDELGDLLFQVVFHAQMAAEQGQFDFAEVANSIADKLERRHPHVFAAAPTSPLDDAALHRAWESHKAAERTTRGQAGSLSGVALALPALQRAAKLGKRAARVNFEWPDIAAVADKVREETRELGEALSVHGQGHARVAEEFGDLLFSLAQYARHLGVDPENSLREANRKFEGRFAAMESLLAADGRKPENLTPTEWDALWGRVKSNN